MLHTFKTAIMLKDYKIVDFAAAYQYGQYRYVVAYREETAESD